MCQTFGIYYNCLEKNFEKIFLKYLTRNSGAKNLWPFHFGNQKKEKKRKKENINLILEIGKIKEAKI